jgi:hypothetical protein
MREKWWTRRGSNPRHSACKADALPTELLAHSVVPTGEGAVNTDTSKLFPEDTRGNGNDPFLGPCPPASEETLRVALAGARYERDGWKAKYEQMKRAFNAADTLCVEIGYALEGKDVPRDKDELLERVVFLRQDRDRLRDILPPERERHPGVGEGSWAVFAERMLDERDAAREEVAALRAQVAALAENGVSLHKAEEAGRQQGAAEERERILAWIDRKLASPAQSVFFRGLKIGRLGLRKGIAANEHHAGKR